MGLFLTLVLVNGWQHVEGLSGQQGADPLNAVHVVIDADSHYQTMDGFGSSQRIWRDGHVANQTGPSPTIPDAVQRTILAQLYTELGLTRVRPHGLWFSTDPVPDGHPGDARDIDGRIAYVKQGMAYGLTTVIGENNPLGEMAEADFEKHAQNTLALLRFWRARGVEPAYQTLMNEPTQNRSWAGAAWHRRVVKVLGPRMRAEGFQTMLVVPDEINACAAYPTARAIVEDDQTRRYVGALAYHMYGGDVSCLGKMAELSRAYHVPVWMTEYSREPGFEGSFAWAKQIHDLIVNYRISAVDYMWGFFGEWSTPRFNSEPLIEIAFGPHATYASHRRTSKYYVTGQFSRFIRRGDVRIGAESDTKSVFISAYRGSNRMVVVLLNDSHSQRSIVIATRREPLPQSFSAVRTTRSEEWKPLASVRRNGSAFELMLPPKSVTTLWGTLATQ
jgi:O-glycosyl hydrolase